MIKNKILIASLIVLCTHVSFAQMLHPDHWTFSSEQTDKSEITLSFLLKLDKEWHVYSQNTPDGGPLPMVYNFEPNSCYKLIGKCEEPTPHQEYDSTFGVNTLTLDGEVPFKQIVKVDKFPCRVKGSIAYQVCKDACIFRDTTFVFYLTERKINGK